ncbi:MAG: hypothetical protein WAO52_09195 [Prolixibacteraceae bacterium]
MKYDEVYMSYFFRNQEIIPEQHKMIGSSEKISGLRNQIREKEPLMEWDSVYRQVLEKCPNLLKIKLKDILLGGWKKYQQIEQYIDQGKANPEVTFTVPIANHILVSEHHPKIKIRINEIELGEIEFGILLKLELAGIILDIKGGEIENVKAGTCTCKGSLSCEGIPILENSSDTFEF